MLPDVVVFVALDPALARCNPPTRGLVITRDRSLEQRARAISQVYKANFYRCSAVMRLRTGQNDSHYTPLVPLGVHQFWWKLAPSSAMGGRNHHHDRGTDGALR